jgi:hypothetical protein
MEVTYLPPPWLTGCDHPRQVGGDGEAPAGPHGERDQKPLALHPQAAQGRRRGQRLAAADELAADGAGQRAGLQISALQMSLLGNRVQPGSGPSPDPTDPVQSPRKPRSAPSPKPSPARMQATAGPVRMQAPSPRPMQAQAQQLQQLQQQQKLQQQQQQLQLQQQQQLHLQQQQQLHLQQHQQQQLQQQQLQQQQVLSRTVSPVDSEGSHSASDEVRFFPPPFA